ncbi:DUF4369 domain-containing protein [Eudoraea sp.]|uniref:DUF4369 domain-containing protein n=1 Tax=Eudoraea sp. TaxID=1979955 RepID=UPI003C75F68F
MKNLFLYLLVFTFMVACSEKETKNTMTISGQVKGLKKGKLYLQHIPDSVLKVIDSLEIDGDGHFEFKTEIESPEIFYLYLDKKDFNEVNDRITFFGEPGVITLNTVWNAFDTKAKIDGSESNKKLEEYRKVMSRFNKTNLEILQAAYDPENVNDSLKMDSIQIASDKNMKRGYVFALNFALNNSNSHIAPYIAVKEVKDANRVYLDSIMNTLSPEVANGKYGKELQTFLEN